MDDWSVVATGFSLNIEQVQQLYMPRTIVVNEAYHLLPYAALMVAQDPTWWRLHPEALFFRGRKFSCSDVSGVERFYGGFANNAHMGSGTNSGLIACCVAQWFGAKRISLYGFDMHGSHYFGEHASPCTNTTPKRYQDFIHQFRSWDHQGIEVINMTPGSALDMFPFGVSEKAIA